MAGTAWEFTVSPNTITTVTISYEDGTDTVKVTAKEGSFRTTAFAETNKVILKAEGYNDVTATVGDSLITFTASTTEPEPEPDPEPAPPTEGTSQTTINLPVDRSKVSIKRVEGLSERLGALEGSYEITADVNFNTIPKVVLYAFVYNDGTALNAPDATGGWWFLEQFISSAGLKVQKAVRITDPAYVVLRTYTGSAWTEWKVPYAQPQA